MKTQILLSALTLSLLFPAISQAREIPNNVKLAAKAMHASSNMVAANNNSHKVQHRGSGACWDDKFTGHQVCKAWYNDFSEDLNYFVAVKDNVVYIAFKGTSGKRNEKLNKDARAIKKHGFRVHQGWWNAKNKAWRKIHPFLKKHAKGRKIIITGHSMGGALAGYTTKKMMHHPAYKNAKIRLVTFGAPRYTRSSKRFFPYQKNMYIYTMETKYRKKGKGKWRIDSVAKTWRGKRPKDKWKHVWTASCKTKVTSQKDVHNAWQYYYYGKSDSCNT